MMESTAMGRRQVQAVEMLPLLKRHEIQVLLRAGHSQRDVAERTGASLDTVSRVMREDEVDAVDDAAERRKRRIGRPSKATPFAPRVSEWLTQEPELPTQELLRRAKEIGYTGHKTAFYALVAGARPPRSIPIVRFEGLPGEFSQHDFGHVDVTFVGGRKKRVHFFASRLKYSRFVAVTLVDDERVETLVRCLARDFVAFDGLPLMAVFDRPKTIVKKGGKGREVEQYNATFAQAIVYLGVGVEMCAPRSGNQKGTVERLVGWVKSSFFKHRQFQDDVDLRAQLAAWHLEVNTQTPSRATGVIPETRRQEEFSRLRPIKVFPEKLALRVPIFVGPTAEVMFEGIPYSMPPEATHVAGTLFLYEDRLHLVAGRFEARQRRRSKGEPPAPLPEHRAAKIAAVHGKRAKLYEKRQQVLNLGPDALALLTELTHREPTLSSRRVEELYALLDEHGDDAMREAIGRAVRSSSLEATLQNRRASIVHVEAFAPQERASTYALLFAQPRSRRSSRRSERRAFRRSSPTWNQAKYVRVSGRKTRRRVTRPRSEWITRECPELAIVAKPLWEAAQARFRSLETRRRGRPFGTGKHVYLISGLLRCGVCGGSMSVVSRRIKKGVAYARFGCVAHHSRGAAICSNALSVSERRASHSLVDALKEKLHAPELVERFIAKFRERATHSQAGSPAADVERRIEEGQRRVANLTEALARTGWSESLASKLRDEEGALGRWKAQRAALAQRSTTRAMPRPAVIASYLANLLALLETDPARGNATLSRFVAPVVMTPEIEGPVRRYRVTGAFNLSFCLGAAEVVDKCGCAGRI